MAGVQCGGGMNGTSYSTAYDWKVEDVVLHPFPGYANLPTALEFSTDDQMVTSLCSTDGTLHRKLHGFHLTSREHRLLVSPRKGVEEGTMSQEEKLRRERLRERGLGVTSYSWSRGRRGEGCGGRLLIPLPDGLYIADAPAYQVRCILPTCKNGGGAGDTTSTLPVLDPQLSPNGNMVAFVRGGEVWVLAIDDEERMVGGGGGAVMLTREAGKEGVCCGLAEYVAQEEMERRNGFWWSEDSTKIAFTKVDTSRIPGYDIMHLGDSDVRTERHPYPFAGQRNAVVTLGVVTVSTRQVVWMDVCCGGVLPEEKRRDGGGEGLKEEYWEYLAAVQWLPSGLLTCQVQDRQQKRLQLLRLHPETGARETVLTEESASWINLRDGPHEVGNTEDYFLWLSERSGHCHIYAHANDGRLLYSVTSGNWDVETVEGVDKKLKLVYFTGTARGPLESHLFVTSFAREECEHNKECTPKCLTYASGRHTVVLDHQLHNFIDVHDSPTQPPRIDVRSLVDGSMLHCLFESGSLDTTIRKLGLHPPTLKELRTEDGTALFGALYLPCPDKYGPGPYKTVVSVYGGPHVQTVNRGWASTVDMRAQYLRSKGFLVWKLDNRGSARRGVAFESVIKNRLGETEIKDQTLGVEWLIKEGLADAQRVAMYGWSYGGYLSAMALSSATHIFRVAVAGAPVTSWDGYDTHYTERYLGLPCENPHGYLSSSILTLVPKMEGRLLLVHGMIDENVHYRHTVRLVKELNTHSKSYELLVFPDERHMPRGLQNRIYMEQRIFSFLSEELTKPK